MFLERQLTSEIKRLKEKFPIVVLTGPRQSGKTTLLKEIFPNYKYVSLENYEMREFAQEDPNGFLKAYDSFVILDEVQQVPKLFSYLQTKTDNDKIMGQYVLSGSQNFMLMQQISQSLAGRVALFRLFPFDFKELNSQKLLTEDFHEAIFKGGYPALYDRSIDPRDYFPNYIETYIERDVRNLLNVKDLSTFRTFVRLCAGRVGAVLNLQSLAADCGISSPTAKAWLSLLETSHLVFLLQPYFQNINKRLVKSPKLYFYDTGLVCNLLGIKSVEQIEVYYQKGNLFENLVIAELKKQNFHLNKNENYWFWRDSNQNEIDVLIENNTKMDLLEIKSSQTIQAEYFKGLNHFRKHYEAITNDLCLIYGGNDHYNRNGVNIKSWNLLEL